jgi:hypothetical protein
MAFPSIQFRNCALTCECIVSTVQYLQGDYQEIPNTNTGKIQLKDGTFLVAYTDGLLGSDANGSIFVPDFENKLLVVTTSFQFKLKFPYLSVEHKP